MATLNKKARDRNIEKLIAKDMRGSLIEDHEAITQRTADRKKKFQEADQIVGAAERKSEQDAARLRKGLRGQPQDLIDKERRRFEATEKIKIDAAKEKSNEIKESLKSNPSRRPADISDEQANKLRELVNNPDVYRKLSGAERIRANRILSVNEVNNDSLVREQVNILANIAEESPELFKKTKEQTNLVYPEDELEIAERTASRKKQFEKADRIEAKIEKNAVKLYNEFKNLLQSDNTRTPKEKQAEEESFLNLLQKEGNEKLKESRSIRTKLVNTLEVLS